MKLNDEQQRAVDARGVVFVSAGAGTGKTKVLVERFARAVCDEGVDVESILVITYTEKAAGELNPNLTATVFVNDQPVSVQVLLDGRKSNSAQILNSYISSVVAINIQPR